MACSAILDSSRSARHVIAETLLIRSDFRRHRPTQKTWAGAMRLYTMRAVLAVVMVERQAKPFQESGTCMAYSQTCMSMYQ
jgi:hypothetical protein